MTSLANILGGGELIRSDLVSLIYAIVKKAMTQIFDLLRIARLEYYREMLPVCLEKYLNT